MTKGVSSKLNRRENIVSPGQHDGAVPPLLAILHLRLEMGSTPSRRLRLVELLRSFSQQSPWPVKMMLMGFVLRDEQSWTDLRA